MKQILISVFTLVAIGALVASGTAALFNDQEVIAGNTVATGTLELTVNKSAGKPYSITGGYPGYTTDWEHIDIFNTGSLPFEAHMSFSMTGGDSDLYDVLKIRLETSGSDSICDNGDADEHLIYDGHVKDFPTQKLVSKLAYWHLANEDDASGSPADNIRAGYAERVCQKLSISGTAGNEIMGKSVTFSEIVDAMQDND
jgi:predicted ribosomally synthesized peptide with SipW-like signal peptide